MISTTKIVNKMKEIIEEYAKRGEQCDVMKALTLLTQAYISQCGISLGGRTVVYCAAEPWQERLAWLDLPLSEMARKEPLVMLMPHISKEYIPEDYDDYDITSMNEEELLDVCYLMIRGNEFDETTLAVICWGILKATEEKPELTVKIEATAPDGTLLKGILTEQRCSATYVTMTLPYKDLRASKYELVRDAKELLVAAYRDYNRLRLMEDEIRALYPQYLRKIKECKKGSALERHRIYNDVFKVLFADMVISPTSLVKEWFGLEIDEF